VPTNRWNSLTIHDHIIIIIQCHVVQILLKNFINILNTIIQYTFQAMVNTGRKVEFPGIQDRAKFPVHFSDTCPEKLQESVQEILLYPDCRKYDVS